MDYKQIAGKILAFSKRAGADKAEVFIQKTDKTSIWISELKIEGQKRASTIGYGLHFISKGRKVFVNSSDFSLPSIRETVDKASQLVKYVEEDQFNDIAQKRGRSRSYELFDYTLQSIPLKQKIDYAMDIERNAIRYDKKIKKASWIAYAESIEERVIANTNGVFGYYKSSNIDVHSSILAEVRGEKQEGEHGLKVHFYRDLPPAEEIASRASFMALSLIGGSKVKSTMVPVVFDPNAGWLIFRFGVFEGAKGLRIQNKTSYLQGRLEEKIASDLVTLIDDGTLAGGVRTAPFDDEGVKTRRNVIVERGVLKMYLYDVYSAGKGKAKPTGNVFRRGYRDTPSIDSRNLYLVKGKSTPRKIISEVKNGFWVKNTIGFGIDSVSGTYSIGAAGRWIRNGKLAEPVSGVTIASTLDALLMGVEEVGNDLEFRYENSTPTFRVSNMTVSGK